MITNEQMAAATMAKIFGSELLRVDQSTMAGEGQGMPATRIDPKKILMEGSNRPGATSDKERRLIEMLQKEAEAAHPITYSQPLGPDEPQGGVHTHHHVQTNMLTDTGTIEMLKSISDSLKRIADNICSNEPATSRKRNLFSK